MTVLGSTPSTKLLSLCGISYYVWLVTCVCWSLLAVVWGGWVGGRERERERERETDRQTILKDILKISRTSTHYFKYR